MSRVMIFGATHNQVPLARKVQQMGHEAWVTAAGDLGPLVGVADRLFNIDTGALDELTELVRDNRVEGLVTCGTSTPICTIAAINERLGLSPLVISHEVALRATYKERFRAALEPIGAVAPGGMAENAREGLKVAAGLRPPLVIKPADGGGGKGVEVVTSVASESFAQAFARSQAWSQNGVMIIEEFLEGITLGVEAMTLAGETFVLAVPQKTLAGFPHCVTTGIFFPSSHLEPHLAEIVGLNRQVIAALGIEWGPTHIDMMLTPSGRPYVIDVGPRLAGGPLCHSLIPAATGYDFFGATIELALGRRPPQPPAGWQPTGRLFGSHFMVRPRHGEVAALSFPGDTLKPAGLMGHRLLKQPGDQVQGITTDRDRLAVFHFEVPAEEAMWQLIDRAEALFQVEYGRSEP